MATKKRKEHTQQCQFVLLDLVLWSFWRGLQDSTFCPSWSLLRHHIWLKISHMVQLANIHFEDLTAWCWTFGALLGLPKMVKIKPLWNSIKSWNSKYWVQNPTTRIRYSFCLSVLESIKKSKYQAGWVDITAVEQCVNVVKVPFSGTYPLTLQLLPKSAKVLRDFPCLHWGKA